MRVRSLVRAIQYKPLNGFLQPQHLQSTLDHGRVGSPYAQIHGAWCVWHYPYFPCCVVHIVERVGPRLRIHLEYGSPVYAPGRTPVHLCSVCCEFVRETVIEFVAYGCKCPYDAPSILESMHFGTYTLCQIQGFLHCNHFLYGLGGKLCKGCRNSASKKYDTRVGPTLFKVCQLPDLGEHYILMICTSSVSTIKENERAAFPLVL